MLKRAHSLLEIKAIDEEQRIIEGIASTPTPDRYEDVVEPLGAKFSLPLPLLWQHQQGSPIGHVESASVSADGIRVRARLVRVDEPGELKTLLDKAWLSIKSGLVRGLSIGFRPIGDPEPIKGSWGLRFAAWEWLELSAVTIPANVDATIQAVKSYDAEAAPGEPRPTSPGAPGTRVIKLNSTRPKEATVTIKEQIAGLEAKRQADAAAMEQLTVKAAERGETFTAEEEEKFDGLKAEIEANDKHLARLRDMDRLNVSTAKAVEPSPATRKVAPVTVKPNVDKGIGMARYAMALLACKGNRYEAAQLAEQRWPDQPEIVAQLKSAVAAGTTTDSTWASPLAQPTGLVNEFLELLRPSTLIGKIPGLRRVPFNVNMPRQTAGGTYSWVGEGAPKPLTKPAYDTVSLGIAKAAGIIVLTEELVRNSSPSAQEAVRAEMLAGMAKYLDEQFIVASNAAVSNVSPGSITNGVTGTAASGTAESNARADIRKLIATLAGNNYPLGQVVLATSESIAFTLGTLVNSLGQTAFPGVTVNGGSILGIPLVTSNSVGAQIVAIHAPSILFADAGVELDISREASLQMDTAPTNPVDATTVLVSLWQHNLVGLRVEHFINWAKGRTTCVDRIHTVAYA